MKLLRRWFAYLVTALLSATISIACTGGGDSADATITVGSKDFTEQLILGEMYALVLEDAGFTVERSLNLGGTPVAQAALENGDIDLYPEYTGTGLLTVLKEPVNSDPQAVYDTVSSQYLEQFDLVWLDPAPMNNTQALAMTAERSQALGITTISELSAQANDLTMIGPPEFEVREDGLVGLKAAYGDFELADYNGGCRATVQGSGGWRS